MINPVNDDCAYAAAEAVALRSRGKLIAYLAARFGDVAAAEDAISEAFASALSVWPQRGCPTIPKDGCSPRPGENSLTIFAANANRRAKTNRSSWPTP